jgi:hypothetical protein
MLGFELRAREAKLAREQQARKEEARRKLDAEQRQEERCVAAPAWRRCLLLCPLGCCAL